MKELVDELVSIAQGKAVTANDGEVDYIKQDDLLVLKAENEKP